MARFAHYAPEFRIRINRETLPAALRGSVMSVSYQDGIEGADRVEVTFANPNLRWLDHALLAVENELSLSIGYAPDPLEEVFVGEITGVDPTFPSGGMPTLRIAAHDFLQRLTAGTKDRAFALNVPCIGKFPIPDPVVVTLVAGVRGLVAAVDPVGAALSFLVLLITYMIDPLEAKNAIRFQRGESDFDFLSRIAKENGWEMFIDHTTAPKGKVLRFKFSATDLSPSVSLRWGQTLMDFSPRFSTIGQVQGVALTIWLPSIKLELAVFLSWDFDRAAFDLRVYPKISNLAQVLGAKVDDYLKIDTTGGPALAIRKMLVELLTRLNNRLTGSASTIGNPKIKAGQVINLEGLGEQFSGLYRITSTNHTFDGSGYKTTFEVRKEVWFGSIPTPKGISGLVRVRG